MIKNECQFTGAALPLGATVIDGGVNFSIFTRNATSVELLIFNKSSDSSPNKVFKLNPDINKTGDIWHIFLKDKLKGCMYLYRIDGPWEPENGHLFNVNNFLIDPYSKALTDDVTWDLCGNGIMPKSIVVCDTDFDWQNDKPIKIPMQHTIIYETHLSGLTKNPNGKFKYPGTYKGVIELIPYFKELGVTTIEFLPLFEFDSYEGTRKNPTTGELLGNYWGYSTCAFFAPKGLYAFNKNNGSQIHEFKEMVRELHKNGLEIILDVVYNHTGEGNENGINMTVRVIVMGLS